jgi:CRP-like cAMP-binding protein
MDSSGECDMAPFRREGQGFHKQPLPKLRPAIHEMIGRRLRLHYEELQQQPLPGRLAQLLAELEKRSEEPAEPRRN